MSVASTEDPGKSMEQPNNDLSEVMGQLTVNSDESPEPPKNLCDMPDDIVVLIIQRSDFKEQLILRKTSKTLRELVDKEKPACTHLSISNGSICKSSMGNNSSAQIEFNDFGFTLKNPKLELEKFEVYHKIPRLMESINHQVSVKNLTLIVSNPSCFLSILPYLKPGVLESICVVSTSFEWSAPAMQQVAQLEQWMQCDEIGLIWTLEQFPMEYAEHFKRIYINEINIDLTKFVCIRDYLSRLPNFEKGALIWGARCEYEDTHQLLETLIDSDGKGETFHHPIPETNYYLEIKFSKSPTRMDIEKKRNLN